MRGSDSKIDLLAIDDLSGRLSEIIDWAIRIKNDEEARYDFKPLDGMTVGSIYEKPSTRTRVSFEVGVSRLGGQPLTLLSGDIQLGTSETIADTAAVLSRYMDCITYRCFGHGDVAELANHSTVPVINALSDMHHPCFEPDKSVISRALEIAKKTGSKIKGVTDPKVAVEGAGAIYTDVFVSMGEEHMDGKMRSFDGFQVNEELVSDADDDYIFMHCLPAHRGEEVTDGVIDSPNSVVFDQAENRMWAQMSILTLLCNEVAWETYWELR